MTIGKLALVTAAGLLATVQLAEARVKLITLPVRERVEVQLDNINATLVEEERIVPLVQGENQVDFSWVGTDIDSETIVFRVLGPAPGSEGLKANVLSVSYPPGEDALIWQVSASRSGSARVRISYLLGGLERSFNYRAVANADETQLVLSQYLRIKNFANEAFKDTKIFAGFGDRFRKPIGLNQTMELLVERHQNVPIDKTLTVDASTFGYLNQAQNKLNVAMHYVIHNDAANQLGKEPLPAGKMRIFQKDPQGTTAFLGEDWGQFTPIDDKMRLFLGIAQDVSVKRRVTDRKTQKVVGNVYDRSLTLTYEVENFKEQPVTLRVVEQTHLIVNELQGKTKSPLSWTIQRSADPATDLSPYLIQNVDDTNLNRMSFDVPLPAAKNGKPAKATYTLTVKFANNF